MMNIYLHELKTKLKSVLIWSASISALILVFTVHFSRLSQPNRIW